MKSATFATVLAVAVLLAGPAFAFECPRDMKKIDAAIESGASLSAADLAKVKGLRASGEAKHKSGDHKGSVEDLHAAMKILGIM